MIMDLSLASNSSTVGDQEQNQEYIKSIEGSSSRPGSSTSPNQMISIEKEHMFDKVVTPSDVGKLNRLVIPKQHAEKYFPLDSSSHEKGLLLNFEDRNGKPWRFRYSYWNSSQSYVMTKGWSRFVKEKKLDAGDIVSFQRGVGEFGKDRLYIDWRTRPIKAPDPTSAVQFSGIFPQSFRWGKFYSFPQSFPAPRNYAVYPYNSSGNSTTQYHYHLHHPPLVHQEQAVAGYVYGGALGGCYVRSVEPNPLVIDSVPMVQGRDVQAAAATGKRLRLFGVNMEYSAGGGSTNEEDHPLQHDCSSSGSTPPPGTPCGSLLLSPSPQLMQPSSVHESPMIQCGGAGDDDTDDDQLSAKKGKSLMSFDSDQ